MVAPVKIIQFFASNGGDVIGTLNGDEAPAGIVGEFITQQVLEADKQELFTGTPLTIMTMVLAPGDWRLTGSVQFSNPSGATLVDEYRGGVSLTMDNFDTADTLTQQYLFQVPDRHRDISVPLPTLRMLSDLEITVHLVLLSFFSVDTLFGYGTLHARRMR